MVQKIVYILLYVVAGLYFYMDIVLSVPLYEMKCVPCEIFCRGIETATSDKCAECMCEPPKDTAEPSSPVLCKFQRCKACVLGYKIDDDGCPTCDCLDKPPDAVP